MITTVFFLVLAAGFLILPPGAMPAEAPADEATPSVSLDRYMGRWYEIARFPVWFQGGCAQSWATYTLSGPYTVTVLNECVTDRGERKSAEGTAKVVEKSTGSKLEVVFHNWFSRLFPFLSRGKYWIFHIDPDYQQAIVGHPNRKYLWILSRTPAADDATYSRLVTIAGNLRFDTTRLVRSKPTVSQAMTPGSPR
jgi:apolipoprotein D and lipocalin family protein